MSKKEVVSRILYNIDMALVWDYDLKKLKQSKAGLILFLERLINYGPERGEKINLAQVRRYWGQLNLFPKRRRLLKLLIWGKTQS